MFIIIIIAIVIKFMNLDFIFHHFHLFKNLKSFMLDFFKSKLTLDFIINPFIKLTPIIIIIIPTFVSVLI
jgi:hypothetical protein